MKFTETRLAGPLLIELQPAFDERGFFAQSWERDDFARRGLDVELLECGISFNRRKGTLRGLHYQVAPFEQTKLVRCTAGAIYDVIVDLRPESSTCYQWVAFELTADNRNLLYVPKGFAHGFQTLADNSEVFYQMTGRYSPEHARGIRWDDARLGIAWPPATLRVMSVRDGQLTTVEGHS